MEFVNRDPDRIFKNPKLYSADDNPHKQYDSTIDVKPVSRSGVRRTNGMTFRSIRNRHGNLLGDIRQTDGAFRKEAWSASGQLLGWYIPTYNLTYDARTTQSIAQGDVLEALIMENSGGI